MNLLDLSGNSSKENESPEKLKPDIEFSLEKSNEIINFGAKTIGENFKFKPPANLGKRKNKQFNKTEIEQNKEISNIEILNAPGMEISRLNNTQKTHILNYSSMGTLVFDKENKVTDVKSK